MAMIEEFQKSYVSYAGCDIQASFNGFVIGSIQGISYNITREKAPVYTMGSASPRSYSRGKRAIAGSMVFTVFDRDALIEAFKEKLNGEKLGIQKFKAEGEKRIVSIEEWDKMMTGYATNNNQEPSGGYAGGKVSDLVGKYSPTYADEILPFDITITFANEYGSKSVQTIYGVEIMNEGAGFSIESITSEKAYTFVARKIDYMRALDGDSDQQISASW